ncbi:hypothetical protein N9948_01940 [bacterium]|nr:hypothetical protein [bacterium]
MGDMGELFNALKEEKKKQKEEFKSNKLPDLLSLLDGYPKQLSYIVKNGGEHYIVTLNKSNDKRVVDLWPSTGKWIIRNKKKTKGNGIKNLLKYFRLPLENSTKFICSE